MVGFGELGELGAAGGHLGGQISTAAVSVTEEYMFR